MGFPNLHEYTSKFLLGPMDVTHSILGSRHLTVERESRQGRADNDLVLGLLECVAWAVAQLQRIHRVKFLGENEQGARPFHLSRGGHRSMSHHLLDIAPHLGD